MNYQTSMNGVCRLVWSRVQNTWVVAAGDAKGRGRSVFKPKLMAVTLALLSPAAFAAPIDGQISAGSGGIAQAGNTTTITQQTQNLAIDWQSFSIGSNEAVHFDQPNSSAIALNRVLGQNPSQILGNLSANGQVFVLNPNGVLFGSTAQVNVGGLVASTLNISNADFMAGNYVYSNGGVAGTGTVENQGTLNALNGGYIALISPTVSNTGSISATQGTVALAAGNTVTLNLNNGTLLGYNIDAGTASALISNGGMIAANGGQVLVTAQGANALSTAVVNNTGIIEARTLQNVGGVIKLMADMKVGTVNVSGTLDASAPAGGDGGFIETSAANVGVADNTNVTTSSASGVMGNWLIDPSNFTIAASGGDITGATLSTNLGTTAVSILSSAGASGINGDVNVNDVVSWSANKLTLNAQRNINVNANLNASGTASLALEYGQGAVAAGNTSNYLLASNVQINLPSGLNFSAKLGSNGVAKVFTVINSLGIAGDISATTLQGMNGNRAGNYVLGSNIDATLTSGWNAGAGFVAVGTAMAGSQFTGSFDGLGHTISNLYINRPTTNDIGMFGYAATGSIIRNVGLVNGSMNGKNSGGLIGQNLGAISNSYFTGSVSGGNNVGGLVGLNSGSVSNSYATGIVILSGTVIGSNNIGGLVGYNNGGAISNSYATGSVSGTNDVGGLVGHNNGGAISNSYATGSVSGSVSGSSDLGGLVGYHNGGTISASFATGSVSGGSNVGGLVGYNNGGVIGTSYGSGNVSGSVSLGGLVGYNNGISSMSNNYATGNVTGGANSSYVGGLVGYNNGSLGTSYSTGSVSGTVSVGGLVGYNFGTISNGYWDKQRSGRTIGVGGGVNAGATGLTTAQSMQQSSYTGFDFTTVWRSYNGHSTPLLKSFLKALTITANDVTKVYDATSAGLTGVAYSDPTAAGSVNLFGIANPYGVVSKNNVGIYAADLWSNQQGYDITIVGGQLTVTPANLVISGVTVTNKVYDSTRNATLGGTASITALAGDVVSLGGSGIGLFADKNAGTGKSVSVNSYTLSGTDAGNYNLIQPTGLAADITRAQLGFNGLVAANKIYDTTAVASITGFGSLTGLFAGDSVGFDNTAAVATFSDKNAGTGKTVTVSNVTITGADAGNYVLSGSGGTATTTANISKRDIALQGLTAANKVYDSTTAATIGGTAYVTVLGTDTVSVGGSGSGVFMDKNVGTAKAVTVNLGAYSLSGTDGGNYNLIQPTGVKADITKLNLEISGVTGVNKDYDGTRNATLGGLASVTALSGDAVSVSGTGTGTGLFADKNAGTGKSVSVSGYSISGTDAGNYNLIQPTGVTANINKLNLAISGVTAANKIYNANRNATLSGTASVTALAGDVVSVSGSGSGLFADKNVGNGKSVSVSGYSIGGADAVNYNLIQPAGVIANITPLNLAINGITAANKDYDGTRNATLGGLASVTALSGDAVSVSGTGTGLFADKNAGTGKSVSVSGYSISGTDAGNYNLIQPTGVKADITKLNISISGISALNKVYDATTAATLSGTASISALAGDVVSVGGSGTGQFADKNVGNGKSVSVSGYSISGTDAGNYSLIQPAGLTADISKLNISISGFSAANKVYDGSRTATLVTGTVNALAGDVVSLSGSGTGQFADKNVGTGKVVTIGSYSLSGTDAGNYNLTQPIGLTADITPRNLTITAMGVNRVYNAGTAATVNLANNRIANDILTTGYGSAAFLDKNAGTGKTINVSGITLTGADAGNYVFNTTATATADISKLNVALQGVSGGTRVYDATTTATLTGTAYVTALGTDSVSVSGSGSGLFADKNVGTNKAVTVNIGSYSLGGTDAGNYSLMQPAGVKGTITKRALTLAGTPIAANRVYDGTNLATISGATLGGVLGTDIVNLGGLFANKNAGIAKAVTLALTGTDGGNYSVASVPGLTANITALALTYTGTPKAENLVYDGTLNTAISGATLVGVLGTDSVKLAGLFADKNVGTGKAVTIKTAGTDGSNYSITLIDGLVADITPRELIITAFGVNRVYNAGTAATVSLANNRVIGDILTAGYGSAAFLDKNAGTGKTINVSGITLGGSDAGNYVYNTTATATASISKLNIGLQGVTAANKVYDGTTAATLGGTAHVTALGTDIVNVDGSGSGLFADKNVGAGRTVTINLDGYTLSGTDAGNYTLTARIGPKADITKRALTTTGAPIAMSRGYNGTTLTAVSGATLGGVLGADVVNVGGLFADKNVGVAKAVSLTLTGTDGGNYSVAPVAGLTANITQLALTMSGTPIAASRVYDGKIATTVSGATLDGVLGTDSVILGGIFADKNVGTGKAVSLVLTGTAGGNYSIAPRSDLAADITPRELTFTAFGVSRIYNAGTAATVNLANNRVAGDILTTGYRNAAFLDKNAGTGKTINVSGITLTGADAGNYVYNTTATATASISKLNIALKGVTAAGRVYNATTAATIGGTAYVAALGTDSVSVSGSGSGDFLDKNAGTGKAVMVNIGGYALGGTDAGNYNLTVPTGVKADITKRALTTTGTPIAASRVYDGTLAASISGVTLTGILTGDSLGMGGLFADKNTGVAKAVSLILTGTDGRNYSVAPVPGVTADITKLALTVSGTPIAASRVYDGKIATTVSGADLGGVLAGDLYTVTLGGNFADKNVGTGKAVSLVLTGTAGGNYSIAPIPGITANITKRDLTITAFGVSRIYNAGTAATVNLANNRVSGDILTTGYSSAAFLDKNVGTDKTINVSGITLGGADAGNYAFNTTATATASISKLNIALKGVTAANKVYDGTTAATIGGTAYVAALGTDTVSVSGSGSGDFLDKNAGTGKAVIVNIGGYALGGTDAGNYNLAQPVGVKANITKRVLTSTGAPIAASRVYDGTLTTSISGAALAGVLGTDIVNLGGLFADKNAGVAKSVSLTTTGNDSGNYSVAPVAGLTANITQLALTVSGTPIAASRVYDGKVATTVSGASLDGVLGADSVILGGNFADKNAGTGKAVSLVLTGTAGANYSIAPIPGITANITKRDLTITAMGMNRVYNAGTAATVNLANNRVSGDILTTGYSSAAFLDKNVGTGKTINVSGITLTGADAGNYAFNTTATATASISKLNIALKGVTAANKVYDGTTAATIGGTAYVSALGTDSVIVQNLPHILVYGSDAAFLDQNAGTGKAVIVNMDFYALSGTDAGNYNLTQPIGVKANITPRSLSVAADNQSMPFGSSLPALTYTVGGLGLVGGDTMASVFSGGLSTLASSTSAIGPYSITRGTLATNSNYTITTYVNGVLTIQ